MNLTEMVSLIQARLGFRNDLELQIIREINLAQYELERNPTFNPYFLWRAKDICICPECIDYGLPAGFIRLDEFSNPLFQPSEANCSYELEKGIAVGTYEHSKLAGTPKAFSIYSSNLRLDVRACGLLRLFYITATTQLTSVILENLWTDKAFNLLMNRAGMSMASMLHDENALTLFTQNYFMAMDSFKRECVAYEDAGMNVVRGGALYEFPVRNIGGWYEAGSIPCGPCDEPAPILTPAYNLVIEMSGSNDGGPQVLSIGLFQNVTYADINSLEASDYTPIGSDNAVWTYNGSGREGLGFPFSGIDETHPVSYLVLVPEWDASSGAEGTVSVLYNGATYTASFVILGF
jgi:hypothetical protein